MWFFLRKGESEREKLQAEKEAEIQSIKSEAFSATQEANENLKKLNDLIEANPDDIVLKVFAATGGDQRFKK